jgi:hypothetical protein
MPAQARHDRQEHEREQPLKKVKENKINCSVMPGLSRHPLHQKPHYSLIGFFNNYMNTMGF